MPHLADITCDVVIPYHTAALRWVPTAIDSVLNQQNAQPIVHVIADAVDITEQQRIRELFQDAPNIYFYSNEESIGPYQSLHKIFSELKTDYIAIQDSDDISLPHRIWHSITSMNDHNADIFAGSIENFVDWHSRSSRSVDVFLDDHGYLEHPGEKRPYCPSGKVLNPAMLMRKSMFEQLNGFCNWFCNADIEFTERAQRSGINVHYDQSVVVLRRLHASSLCHNEEYGIKSKKRAILYKDLYRRFELFEKEFDPKQFGSLHEVV